MELQAHKKTFEMGGETFTLETGRIARQATGAVLVSTGDTAVLGTVVGAKEPKPGQGFFPLTVNYQEKTYLTIQPLSEMSNRWFLAESRIRVG